jgi:cytochrome c oxidase subunit II
MRLILVALGILAVAGCSSASKLDPQQIPAGAPMRTIEMTAKRYEFSPNPIQVKAGTHVILHVKSLDSTHGLAIPAYGVDVELPPDKVITVEFYAERPGTFPFSCSKFCGPGHWGMKGRIIVEP